jgi:centractin
VYVLDVDINSYAYADEPPNWDDLEALWEYLYEQLGADMSQHPVIVTQPALPPLSLEKKMSEVFFEKFNVPNLFIATGPLLAAYAYGSSTGLVVDIGDSSAQCIPLIEGYMMDAHVRRVHHLGGKKDTKRVIDFLLSDQPRPENYATESHVHSMARHLKDTLAYCAPSAEAYDDQLGVMDTVQDFLGTGEDGGTQPGMSNVNMLALQKELLNCGEVLFQPKAILNDYDDSILSVPELIADCVARCDIDTRGTLLSNIFLSGGVCTMPGFRQRLEKEVKELIPHARNIKVRSSEARYAVWSGGSILSQLDSFSSYCSKATYQEAGMYMEGGDEDLLDEAYDYDGSDYDEGDD